MPYAKGFVLLILGILYLPRLRLNIEQYQYYHDLMNNIMGSFLDHLYILYLHLVKLMKE